MNNAILVTEVVANQGRSCAFKGEIDTLGVGRRTAKGLWLLRLPSGTEHRCEDFDDMRERIREAAPGGKVCFERRRILARRHARGRLVA